MTVTQLPEAEPMLASATGLAAARRRPRVQVVAIAVAGTLQCLFELLLHAGPQCAVINGTAIVPAAPRLQ